MSVRPESERRSRRARASGPFSVLKQALADLPEGGRLDLGGLPGAGPAWLAARLLADGGARPPVLVVCPHEAAADRFADDLAFFLKAGGADPEADDGVVRLPADEILPYDDGAPDRGTLLSRMAALDRLRRGEVRILVVGVRGLAQRLPPPGVEGGEGFTLRPGEAVDRDDLARRLALAGYQNAPLVEDPGTFSVRGGIVDLWSPRHDRPVRVELFGDEIDALRAFDPETQRTIEAVEVAEVSPAQDALFTPETIRRATAGVRELAGELGLPTRSVRGIVDEIERGQAFGIEAFLPAFYDGGLVPLSDWLPKIPVALVQDPAACDAELLELFARARAAHEEVRARGEAAFPPEAHLLDPDAAWATLGPARRLDVHELLVEGPGGGAIRFDLTPVEGLRRAILDHVGDGALLPLVRRLEGWRRKGRTVALVATSPGQADRLRRLLEDRDVSVHAATGVLDPSEPKALGHPLIDVHLLVGDLSAGFEDAESGLVLLSEADLLGTRPARRPRRASARPPEEAFAAAFQDLSEGDLVVHVEHGIGRYLGLTHLSVRGVEGDFLLIAYAGNDKIYLPIHRLGQVQRYVGAEAEGVKLDRLGGHSFALRKKKVKEELLKMAAELLDIYAARKAHPGTAFSAPDGMYREFEAGFPYDETEDQARAIDEVVSDMQKPEPMDRLVCGDVGYGKTEVAMRAAMKAVLDGKQVAVLVPTTVLAAQHERTFKERFSGYPVIVEAVSRFQAPAQVREILGRVAEGKVDVLIGTHRLLSRDLAFKDLGLLVIDEEQHFGVAQKEKLKKLRRQVDVLTLTATPIPRTLHMSLSGIRDLSIIATPPADRRAIRTFVSRFDGETIREAVHREIARGGQVFFVHNRVRSIGAMGKYLEELLPDARIVVAHGQMTERVLESAMSKFVRREADVLLASAIIESGLDMPSVNTILVSRADTFGLAQLYQLRGRVGRSRARAYCYLLVPARRPVTPQARKRLAAIQQLTELGSGFRLASHDMEIRGAGNLLGKQQSGQVSAVGFDLYTELLDESVRELRGEPPKERFEPEVNLPLSAFLPDDYVPDVHQRLVLYNRLAQAKSWEDLEDLRVEIIDRYGPLPVEAEQLLRVRGLHQTLEALRLAALDAGPARLVVTLGARSHLGTDALQALVERRDDLRLTDGKLIARIAPERSDEGLLDAADALLAHLSSRA
jgi:transcription-repair coupling factor (superfamily II helicase)